MSDESIRLSKRLTELGPYSRREADELIEQGRVRVDGQVVDTLGSRVLPGQRVEVLAAAATVSASRVTLLFNKPAGLAEGEDGVAGWLKPAQRQAHGASDILFLKRHLRHLQLATPMAAEASGLVVLTQERRLVSKLQQSRDFEHEWLLWTDKPVDAAQLARLNGVRSLDGVALRPFKLTQQAERQLRLVLRETLPSGLAALCAVAGIRLVRSQRIRVGQIAVTGLAPGQWRYLGLGERF
ncbi:S4 domain-containing protein [Chitinolyticbacter meiyuanensis]|uniref:S4 domain-containing protein n=1 Tax=Chitinolyticbacter meiyuanensis TaxID=682798 RepID=UPI001652231E|nr:RNA pseudouridine synthase [Chitinolyticbacter meiyuanensis]